VGVPPYLLTWAPAPEPDFDYFTLYGSEYSTLDGNAVLIGTTANTSYDVQSYPHKYYHLMATDDAGNESEAAVTDIVTAVSGETLPEKWVLHGNVPNPFNPTTQIHYSVPTSGGEVSLRIYDVRGRLIKTLVEGQGIPGERSVTWNGRDERGQAVASGVYFYRLSVNGFDLTRKMVLTK